MNGKDVCDFCKGDIADASKSAGVKSVKIISFDKIIGVTRHYYWQSEIKSIKEIK